jgi:hypothetical protein
MAYAANYTPSDMPNIATDVIGTGGIQFKVYMPLFIMAFVFLILAGVYVKIRRGFQ